MLSRDYNYLDVYLNFVKHPLNVGFKITDNRMYLMIRDDNKLQKQKADYTTKVEMLCVPFDKESKAIKNTVVERKIYTLDALKYESLEDCFSLGDDNWDMHLFALCERLYIYVYARVSFFGLYCYIFARLSRDALTVLSDVERARRH